MHGHRSMIIENVINGFRTTGVYLTNRAAISIKTPVKYRIADLEAKTIHYLPLYSPSRHTSPVHNTTFATEEIVCFQHCYEEGTPQPLSPHFGEVFPSSVSCSPDISRPEVEKCHGSQVCQLLSVTTLSNF